MTEFEPRFFADDDAIRHLGEGLLACSLRREEWTHEAHLAACLWLVVARPDIDLDHRLAELIAAFNESVGGVNDDHHGYHDTITHAYLAGVRLFVAAHPTGSLSGRVNALLASPVGRRDWPLRFYSRDRLMSVAARRDRVTPDLAPFPEKFSDMPAD